MNERIKELRKTLKISQEEFGDRIGITGSGVSRIESGSNNIAERTVKAICKEFNVDYMWLTTGSGEMFVDTDDDFMEKIDRIMVGENDVRKNMIKTLLYASDDDIESLNNLIDYYIDLRHSENKEKD